MRWDGVGNKVQLLLQLDPTLAEVLGELILAQLEPRLDLVGQQSVDDLAPRTEGSDVLELAQLGLGQEDLGAVLDADGRGLLEAAALLGPLLELDVVPVGEGAGLGLGGLRAGQFLQNAAVRSGMGWVSFLDLDEPLHNVGLAGHGRHLEEGVAADLAAEGEGIDVAGGEEVLDDGRDLTALDGVSDGTGGLVGVAGLGLGLPLAVLGLLLLGTAGIGSRMLALGLIVGYLRWLGVGGGGRSGHGRAQTIDRGLLHTAREHLLQIVHRTAVGTIGPDAPEGGKCPTQVGGTAGLLLLSIIALLGGMDAAPRFIVIRIVIGVGRGPTDEAGHGGVGGVGGMLGLFFIILEIAVALLLVIPIRALLIVVIAGPNLGRVGRGGGLDIELELGIGLVGHLVGPADTMMMVGLLFCVCVCVS
mmetsp:Transcript_31855/g.93589  ORF Transcript_31855/g.93589 Transcript_31855/m.93589 type:complete len:417 (-) Transcript_31855:274-1524(-)